MGLEFGENVVEALARDFHLIKRLHDGEPRVGALFDAHVRAPNFRARRTKASAASAASAPLSPCLGSARATACCSFSTVRIPLPSGSRFETERSVSARALSLATISK